jgi:hypothetical protein
MINLVCSCVTTKMSKSLYDIINKIVCHQRIAIKLSYGLNLVPFNRHFQLIRNNCDLVKLSPVLSHRGSPAEVLHSPLQN